MPLALPPAPAPAPLQPMDAPPAMPPKWNPPEGFGKTSANMASRKSVRSDFEFVDTSATLTSGDGATFMKRPPPKVKPGAGLPPSIKSNDVVPPETRMSVDEIGAADESTGATGFGSNDCTAYT